MSRPEIVVIGSYNADLILTVADLPGPGETCLSLGRQDAPGGKGSNQAVQAALCGARVAFVGAIGHDDAGRAALDLWARTGVDASHVQQLAQNRTGMAAILVDRSGENCIVVDSGANAALTPDHVVQAGGAISGATLVLAQLETPVETIVRAFELARAAGVTTALNAAPAPEQIDARLLALADLLFVNEGEARALTGLPDVEPAAQALLRTVRQGVVATLGADGAVLFRPDAPPLRHPAIKVEVVDTTGAGDAFIGAFAARLAATGDVDAAMSWGAAAGALACTASGATVSYADGARIQGTLAS